MLISQRETISVNKAIAFDIISNGKYTQYDEKHHSKLQQKHKKVEDVLTATLNAIEPETK